jgi:hypothetical protein
LADLLQPRPTRFLRAYSAYRVGYISTGGSFTQRSALVMFVMLYCAYCY